MLSKELGVFLRRKELHATQLREWTETVKAAAPAGLTPPKRSRAKITPEEKRIRALEKDLNRKDRALAEVTAIPTL